MSALEKIERWLNALEQFDPWQSCCTFFRENEADLVRLNVEQMQSMRMPDGSPITVQYGYMGRAYDLYNTGVFYSSITITTDADKIEFTSTDPKWMNEVGPSPGYWTDMTPLSGWFGMVLGLPDDQMPMVEMAVAENVADDLHKCFE